ncbi:ABC transporter substrate-binding protein [Rhodococcus rhodochrous]|uniref:ABC transporter substrate-binding protein n=1 Tax=Rhodococcus rhodochrous TaxID=1829 RepID=UPI0027DF586B|nr:ABC transporter substrate-binding protein [Rhodococcus rhodochrous]
MTRAFSSATAACAALSLLALAGCSSGTEATAGATETVDIELVDQMTPASTGLDELRWVATEPRNIDPAFTGTGQMIYSNMCENILVQNPDYSVEPNLGAVEQPDDLTYNITMRDDVEFWDGTPMTAADAVWSFQRQLDPNLGSNFQVYVKNVDSVEQTGTYTWTIKMKSPDAMFGPLLATGMGNVVSKAWGEANPGKIGTADGGLMCTGPYVLESWRAGSGVSMTANPDYWDAERAPLTPRVEFVFNEDPASVIASLSTGEIDGAFDFALSALEQLRSADGTVTFGPSLAFWNLHFINVEDGPLNLEQRQALTYALDYQGIINGVLKGTAEEDRALTPKSSWGYGEQIFQEAWEELPTGRQNLEEAQRLIEAAGKPSETFKVAYSTSSVEAGQIATAVQAAGQSIGINVELRGYPQAQFSPIYFDPAAREREDVDMYIMNGYMDAIPEPVAWYLNFISSSNGNFANVTNPPTDEWMVEASRTLDDDARAELVVQAQQYWIDNALVMPVASPYTRVYTGPGITGAPASDTYRVFPWAAQVGADQ